MTTTTTTTSTMKPATAHFSLGIHRIKAIDLDNPMIQAALAQTRLALLNPRLRQILEIRTAIQNFLCQSLQAAGYVHPPVYMLAGCTDPLNHWTFPARLNYYGEEVSVTQSLILQKILLVMLSPLQQVYWASPNIRLEMRIGRKEYKYTTEFMQVDFEKRNANNEEMLNFISGLLSGLYRHLNHQHGGTIRELRGCLLPELDEPLAVYDAREVKQEHGLRDDDAVERFGSGLQANGRPFFIVNLRREAYDCWDDGQQRFMNYDIVLPPFGDNPHPVECLSGAERTRSLAALQQRMEELQYPMEYFQPFFKLYDSLDELDGKITTAGAGFGVERLTYGILGLRDVHEVYPFPRMAEGRIAF